MKRRRFALWGVLVLAVVAGLVYAFRPQPVSVDFAQVAQGSLVVTVDEEAETRVRDVFVLSAPVTGRLRRIEAEVGDRVIAGETMIAQIEPADPAFLDLRSESQARALVQAAESGLALAKAELVEAIAELEFAESELERAEELSDRGIIARRTLDDTQRLFKTRTAAVTTAQAAVDMRQFILAEAKARLLSPTERRDAGDECDCISIVAPVTEQILPHGRESKAVVEAGLTLVDIGVPE